MNKSLWQISLLFDDVADGGDVAVGAVVVDGNYY